MKTQATQASPASSASQALRAYLQLASGLTEVTRQRATDAARALSGQLGVQGEDALATAGVAASIAAGSVQTLADDLLAAARSNRKLISDLVRVELDRAIAALGLVDQAQLESLKTALRRLADEIGGLGAHAGLGGDAHRASSAEAEPLVRSARPTKKAATKKAATKKAATKKAAAKKPASARTSRSAPSTAAAPDSATPATKPAAKQTTKKTTAKKTTAKKATAKKATATAATAPKPAPEAVQTPAVPDLADVFEAAPVLPAASVDLSVAQSVDTDTDTDARTGTGPDAATPPAMADREAVLDLDAPILDAPILDAPILDAPILDAPILDAAALDASALDASAFGAAAFEPVVIDVAGEQTAAAGADERR